MENFVRKLIMKKFVTLSGAASNIRTITTTSGDINKGKGSINTSHQTTFRLDGTPARYSGIFSIAEGDDLLLIGKENNGEIVALSIKNNTTGVVSHRSIIPLFITSLVFIAIGLIGVIAQIIDGSFGMAPLWLLFVISGLLFYYVGEKNNVAKILLQKELSAI